MHQVTANSRLLLFCIGSDAEHTQYNRNAAAFSFRAERKDPSYTSVCFQMIQVFRGLMLWRRDVSKYSSASIFGVQQWGYLRLQQTAVKTSDVLCLLCSEQWWWCDVLTCPGILYEPDGRSQMAMNIERKIEQVATDCIVLWRGRIWGQEVQIVGVKRSKWLKAVHYEGIRRQC